MSCPDWSLLDAIPPDRPLLTRSDFDYDPEIRAFRFDLSGGRMIYHSLGETGQGLLCDMTPGYDESSLVRWLDRACRQEDIIQVEMLEFCRRAVESLLDAGHDLERLFQGRKLLGGIVSRKIDSARFSARKTAFRKLLNGQKAVKLAFEGGFVFLHPIMRKIEAGIREPISSGSISWTFRVISKAWERNFAAPRPWTCTQKWKHGCAMWTGRLAHSSCQHPQTISILIS